MSATRRAWWTSSSQTASKPRPPTVERPHDAWVVVGALGDDEDRSPGGGAGSVDGGGQLLEQRAGGRVVDGVDGVDAQPVDVEVLDPAGRALEDRAPHRVAAGLGDVDGRAPRGVHDVGEVGPVLVQHAADRADVVVDDVEDHAEPGAVGGVDEAGQRVGAAVRVLHGRPEHAVVAPVAVAGELVERHQLDVGDAEHGQAVELTDGGVERARPG